MKNPIFFENTFFQKQKRTNVISNRNRQKKRLVISNCVYKFKFMVIISKTKAMKNKILYILRKQNNVKIIIMICCLPHLVYDLYINYVIFNRALVIWKITTLRNQYQNAFSKFHDQKSFCRMKNIVICNRKKYFSGILTLIKILEYQYRNFEFIPFYI